MLNVTYNGEPMCGGDNWEEIYEVMQDYIEENEVPTEVYNFIKSRNDWEELMLTFYELEQYGIK